MTTNDSVGKKAAKGLGNFLVGLLMFIILFAITLYVMGTAVFEFLTSDVDTPKALTMGIVLSLIYAIIVFVIPYLRKMNAVKWFAYCALGDAAYWAYLLFTN